MVVSRHDKLSSLANDGVFDVIVLGGGVNGIGVYRDLAMQGLRVLLVERNDFASGCSAAPSRMIHGGLRYLENGEFDLVRESLRERDLLLRNAPHMVRPMPTLIPITSVFSGVLNAAANFLGSSGKPSSRGALPIKIGLSVYDWVTRKRRVLPRYRFNSGAKTKRDWPDLMPEATCSAVYFDAWISHPERLCVEMIKDVALSSETNIALNYAEMIVENGAHGVVCKQGGKRFYVSGKAIVNATGAWLDDTALALGTHPGQQMVSGTKGSHLVIDNQALVSALRGHMVYFQNADGRICIAFPYQGHVLAGSTDIRVARAKRVGCEDSERDYILASLRLVFPKVAVTPDEVVFSYSGIRPLPKSDQDFTGRISRGHFTRRVAGSPAQFCMVGGKWTTFRAFAEQTADDVLAELGRKRVCSTSHLPIGGGTDFPQDAGTLVNAVVAAHGVDRVRAAHLVDHYGTNAFQVMQFCDAQEGDEPLCPGSVYTIAEIEWLIAQEYVEMLSDIILRRTSLAISGRISSNMIAKIAQRLAIAQQSSVAQMAKQIETLTHDLGNYHGLTPAVLKARNIEGRRECA